MKTIKKRECITRFWFLLLVGLLGGHGLSGHAANPEPAGWYAGDMHVHRSCGGSPEAVSSLYSKMSTNDLAAISLLADMGNGEVQNPVTDLPLVNGQDASVSTPGRIVHWDAEWHWDATYGQYDHQALGGHVVALGLSGAEQIWEEYTHPIFNWAHQRNGIAGFVHMQYLDDGIPQSLNCCIPIEYPVEVALGTADFIAEDVTGSDFAIQAYYRLLNNGFRPGFAAGTDYPCGVSQLGSLLTYVQVAGGQMTYRNWIEGIKQGRTVVSRNGHNEFLNLTVNNTATPGDEIKLTSSSSVQVTITWTAKQNLTGTIELMQNGVVVESMQASVTSSTPVSRTTMVDFAKSGWLAARRMGSNGHQLQTGAVFVTVNDAPVRVSATDAEFYVQWMDNLLEKTSLGGSWSSYFDKSLSAAQARYRAAKAIYQQIASEAGATPQPLAITSTSLPDGILGFTYSATLAAGGGNTPYSWSITSGLPPGLTLNNNSGAITGTPTMAGYYSFTVQVSDAGNPGQNVTKALSITIAATPPVVSTIWPTSATPSVAADPDTSAAELGVKFRSSLNGFITGIRFYKGTTNTGTHIGSLWDSSGNLQAQATFINETDLGWQQISFSTPVAITANTTYVASYHAPNGHYSVNEGYFASTGFTNGPLYALRDGESGGNGVYSYGSVAFPSNTYQASNYWVDIVFQPAGVVPTLTAITLTPANPSISVGATQQFTATGTYSDGTTQNLTSQVTWTSATPVVATINATGSATGVSAGTSTISANINGTTGSTVLTIQAAPLTITTDSLPSGTLGLTYSASVEATGGVSPYNWSIGIGALPNGLTLNPVTGAITGTPTTAVTENFTVKVSDASSPTVQTASKALSLTVQSVAAAAIAVDTVAFRDARGTVTTPAFSTAGANELLLAFVASDGPTAAGSQTVTVSGAGLTWTLVRRTNNQAGTSEVWRAFAPAALTNVTVQSLPAQSGYDQSLTVLALTGASGVGASAGASAASGAPSVTLTTTGSKAWVFGVGNDWDGAVARTLGTGQTMVHQWVDTPVGDTFWVQQLSNAVAAAGTAVTISDTAPTTNRWNLTAVEVVPGTLAALQSIAVTPTTPTIQAATTQQFTATGTYSDGTTQNLMSQVTWASATPAVATISASGLATGLSIGASTISATFSGITGSTVLTVEAPPLAINTASLPGGTVGQAYSLSLAVSGGVPPYSWSISSGSLPAGLSLNADTGAITGTPASAGLSSFTVQVSDASSLTSQIASKALSITIANAVTNTGFLAPTTNAAVTSNAGDNNGFQTTPANAYGDDGLFAVDTNSGTNTNTSCTNNGKDKHIYRDYGFELASAAAIKGIEVRLDAKVDNAANAPKMCVQLSWNGGLTWTAAKSTATLTTAEATYILGGAADIWGHIWAVDDFSNTNCRVRVINVASSTARDFSLDWVTVRVTYQ